MGVAELLCGPKDEGDEDGLEGNADPVIEGVIKHASEFDRGRRHVEIRRQHRNKQASEQKTAH